MATKVIKLQNSSYTLLPVTDASLVQMTVDNETKSVYDVILEDEEVTAAAFNDLDSRLETVEGDYVTKTYAANTYLPQTTAETTYLKKTDFNTFKGTVETTYLKKTDFNTFKGTVETTYLKKSAAFWGSLGVQTTASYITEPEFKTVKINGSTTNAASTKNCVLQYDTTNECLNFVFN